MHYVYFDRDRGSLFFLPWNFSAFTCLVFCQDSGVGKASKLSSQRREIVTLPEITATFFSVLLFFQALSTSEKSNSFVLKQFCRPWNYVFPSWGASVNESFYHLSSREERKTVLRVFFFEKVGYIFLPMASKYITCNIFPSLES